MQLLEQYPLDKWLYTEHIQIDKDAIPHSHPVLTLHTRHLNDSQQLIATYIHEQIHWFCLLVEKAEASFSAMDVFRQLYPLLPVGYPDGCDSEFSNVLHILVNYLEYQGLIELFGFEVACHIIQRKTYYKKIYELALSETEKIGAIMAQHELLLPEKPPEPRVFLEV